MSIPLQQQVRSIQSRVDRNLRFGIARGLTQTAKQSSDGVKAQLPAIFDRPTPFTQNAIAITPANKTTLTAAVFVKDIQAKYLEMEESGGTRTPQPGSPINIPVAQRVNQYGNIARGALGRVRQQPGVFVSNGQGRTAHLRPGIYLRPTVGTRRDGSKGSKGPVRQGGKGKAIGGRAARGATGLKLLVEFERTAVYQPKFGFRDRVTKIVNANLKANIAASITEAMRPQV